MPKVLFVTYDRDLKRQLREALEPVLKTSGISPQFYDATEPLVHLYGSSTALSSEERLVEAVQGADEVVICCTEIGRTRWQDAFAVVRKCGKPALALLASHQDQDFACLYAANTDDPLKAVISVSRFQGPVLADKFPGVPSVSGPDVSDSAVRIAHFMKGQMPNS